MNYIIHQFKKLLKEELIDKLIYIIKYMINYKKIRKIMDLVLMINDKNKKLIYIIYHIENINWKRF